MKRPKQLQCVALMRDLPEFGLKRGHVGTVVLVYEPDAVEVEFMDSKGDTHAVLTLLDEDVRIATNADTQAKAAPEPWPEGVSAPIADATVKAKQ